VRTAILALLLLVAPPLALASGYALPNTNPRDLSMSASAVAAQRDATATFALPAALGRLRGLSLSLGAGGVNVFDKWTDPTPGATLPPYSGATPSPVSEPGSQSVSLEFTPFPNVAVSYGGRVAIPGLGERGWGVGISVEPFGGARVKWPEDWAGRYRIVSVDRRVFSGILGAGLELHPQLRIGGGLIYYYTWEKLTQKAWMEPFGNTGTFSPGYPDATGKLDVSGGAFSYDASLELDPFAGVPFTIAVDYKHKATQDLSGSVTWTGMSPVFSGAVPPQLAPLQAVYTATSAKHQLTIPNTLNVGLAYRLTPPVLLAFTYTFDRWIVYDADTFSANTGGAIVVPRRYGNGHTFRGGVEWSVTPAVALRAGLQRDQSGLVRSTYSPTLPDQSSWAGSLGAGLRFGAVTLDGAVFYARMDKITATNTGLEPGIYPPGPPAGVLPVPQPGTTFRGSYQPQAVVYSLALSWTPAIER
jgi:long-chain fatty acid transport protein